MDFKITKMTSDYCYGFAYVIYTAWEETYRGLMPDSILEGRSMEKWIERAKENPDNKYVALAGRNVIGALGFLPASRDFVTDKNSGEIVALYVLKDFQKQGVGKSLLKAGLQDIKRRNVTLFVLKGNENAVGFYRKMGFEFTGKEIFDNGLTELEMILRR